MSLFRFSAGHTAPLRQPEDFARFYEHTHRSVFRYVMALVAGNQDEAEEITAETFTRAWEKRQQFSGSSSAALGWALAIARNLLIDRRRLESTHPTDQILEEALSDPGQDVEEWLIGSEQIQQVLAAMQRLPLLQRDVLTLRYVLGWRVKAIAAHLGLAENTVSVDLRRALAKVQHFLQEQEIHAMRAG